MDHNSQLLKGVLDMCLLSLIADEPSYGYEMAAKLKGRGLQLVSDGSIYPTLSRLQKAGLVEGYFVEADGSGLPGSTTGSSNPAGSASTSGRENGRT